MFNIDNLPEPEHVLWSRLEPGMIFLDGLLINDAVPPELREYPVLDTGLIDQLYSRYRLRKDRRILVLPPDSRLLSPRECMDELNRMKRGVTTLNGFRASVQEEYRKFDVTGKSVMHSPLIRDDSLVFKYSTNGNRPSLLNRLDLSLSVSTLLAREAAEQIRLPRTEKLNLHLVADYSYSMEVTGRDDYVRQALNLFFTYLKELFPEARFFLYGFSDSCRVLTYPVTGRELPRKETMYGSFITQVLRNCDSTVPDCVILLTDGLPTDRAEALKRLPLLPRHKIDYIQCVFNIEGDKREFVDAPDVGVLDGYVTGETDNYKRFTGEEYKKLISGIQADFTQLTTAAEGSQLILSIDEALGLISVECFDRWISSLG